MRNQMANKTTGKKERNFNDKAGQPTIHKKTHKSAWISFSLLSKTSRDERYGHYNFPPKTHN